ncbi:hypothetical protein B9Z55_022483 [Caenorhabditis nigoni]|nr:hypothetical protein B9Z55_022483 [Caenorhabditis nigoni]
MPRPTPGSYVFVKRSWRLPSQWFFPLIYYPPRMLGRFDAKIILLPPDFRRRYRKHRPSTAATLATQRVPIRAPAAPPVVAIQPTTQTPGILALAASNQSNIPAVVGPPVVPIQQVGVPAAPSAPLPGPPFLPAPHGPLNTPAHNALAARSAPAIPLQAVVAIPVPPTQPALQGIPIDIPAAPIQLAAVNQLPPQAPQVAAQPEIDNEHPMYEPPFENDYYGHNGADPENEDLWAGVHIYGPGLYRLIDPKNPYLTKEQAQAAQKVWETVQAHMTAEAPQGNEVLLN